MNNIKKLQVFDFDGTLYRNPQPNPVLYDNKTFGKITNSYNGNGYGWHHNVITLNPKYATVNNFIQPTVDAAKNAIHDKDTMTIMMTGRLEEFRPLIEKLLIEKELFFDRILLKPSEDYTTFNYKIGVIEKILKDNPNILEVTIWDDRDSHIKYFTKWAETYSKTQRPLLVNIKHVKYPIYHLPINDEKDILDVLKADSRFSLK